MSTGSSLYRRDVCGNVIRDWSNKTALGHVHYDDDGKYLGKEGEGRYIEFEDDGRQVEDIRYGVWLA